MLPAAERDMYLALVGAGTVDASQASIRQAFADIFPAGTTSRSNLAAVAKRRGSRAELLFGRGVRVSNLDVPGVGADQGFVKLANGKEYHSDKRTFRVHPNL